MPASGHPIKPVAGKRQKASGTNWFRTLINDNFVDEIGFEKGPGHRRPALDQKTGDAAIGQSLKRIVHDEETVIVDRDGNNFRAAILQRVGVGVLFVGGADEPDRYHQVIEQLCFGGRPQAPV
jgi:hypothetical protein